MATEQTTPTLQSTKHSYVLASIPLDQITREEQVRKDWRHDDGVEKMRELTERAKEWAEENKQELGVRMETFVVLTSDDKEGTLSPDVIGPFDDEDAATRFVTSLPDRASVTGGYVGAILVNALTATSPAEWFREWEWEENEDDENVASDLQAEEL